MINHPTIAVIGAGVMGEAIISGLLKNGVAQPESICIADPLVDRMTDLQAAYGVKQLSDNAKAAEGADLVVLSVKPQNLNKVLSSLKGRIDAQALVFSIIAGASIQSISSGLDHNAVVRCMPNTPAQIGKGITVWTASLAVSEDQKDLARQVLEAMGEEVFVEEEYYLDMATALSGTGPAYVFLFLEALIDAGVHLGFPRRIAEQLVFQTLRGSLDYFEMKKEHPAHLRNQVTSPGGTSAAALYYLEKAGFRTALSRAIWAAYERSVELGQGKTVHVPEKNSQE